MASEHSMDIIVQFDFQELKNAVEQTKKECITRYDLKDSNIEIELSDENIKLNTANEFQMETVYGVLLGKTIVRGLSGKIFDRQKVEEAGGMRFRQEIKLIKALDQENAKKISQIIRENFPKSKAVIQGTTLRITSKSIDELQEIMAHLKKIDSLKVPLQFTNYR